MRPRIYRTEYYSATCAGHSALAQQESGFWQSAGHSAFLQHVSAFGHSAFLQQESAFWQHSTAGCSQHFPSLQAACLQQPIAQRAMAAINKIFFIKLKNFKNCVIRFDILSKSLQIYIKYCTYAKKIVLLQTIYYFFYKFMAKLNKNTHSIVQKLKIVLINGCIAIAVVSLIIIGVFLGIKHHTQHGMEIVVPNITGMYFEEAQVLLASEGLRIEVIDSTYSTKTPLGTLLEQTPKAGSKVKDGRTIYVIQNARFRRPVMIPELRDISLRQARATILSLGLEIKDTIYEPSTYKDIVLDIRIDNQPVTTGAQVPEGTPLTIVVGKGAGVEQVSVPSVVGKSLNDARSWLINSSLIVGVVEYDIPPTEETQELYIVYSQTPQSGTVVVEGTTVNLKLSTDIEKTVTADNTEEEEEFF